MFLVHSKDGEPCAGGGKSFHLETIQQPTHNTFADKFKPLKDAHILHGNVSSYTNIWIHIQSSNMHVAGKVKISTSMCNLQQVKQIRLRMQFHQG